MVTISDKRALAELVYPGDLHATVTQLLNDDQTWRAIATTINNELSAVGYTVSRESLRRWYGTPSAGEAA
jgi:hypothetical protein